MDLLQNEDIDDETDGQSEFSDDDEDHYSPVQGLVIQLPTIDSHKLVFDDSNRPSNVVNNATVRFNSFLQTLDAINLEDYNSMADNCYALHITVAMVTDKFLIDNYEIIKKVVISKLEAISNVKGYYDCIQFLMVVLATSLKSQQHNFWNIDDNKSMVAGLISFTMHHNAGVRSASRKTLRFLLSENTSKNRIEVSPMIEIVAIQVKEMLECSYDNENTVEQILCLLRSFLHRTSETTINGFFRIMIQLGMKFSSSKLGRSIFYTMKKTFERLPHIISFKLIAETIWCIRNLEVDAHANVYDLWLQVVCEACCWLSKVDMGESSKIVIGTLDIFAKAFCSRFSLLSRTGESCFYKCIAVVIGYNRRASEKCLEVLEKSFYVLHTVRRKATLRAMIVVVRKCKNTLEGPTLKKLINTLAAFREINNPDFGKDIDNVMKKIERCVLRSSVITDVQRSIKMSHPDNMVVDEYRRLLLTEREQTRDQFYSHVFDQCFGIPRPIIQYMAENPSSPEVYRKLISCCKYFFMKNPIIVMEYVCIINGHMKPIQYFEHNVGAKYWIKDLLLIHNSSSETIIDFFGELYVRKIPRIVLYYGVINIDVFEIIYSHCDEIRMESCHLCDEAGELIEVGVIEARYPRIVKPPF